MEGMRFLLTADWQLGMRAHFLDAEARARYTEARFEAVSRAVTLARDEGCELVLAAGDLFESNHVDRRTVSRALDALSPPDAPPIYLLPGNHDPLDGATVYRHPAFAERRPGHVHVLEDRTPRPVRPGLEVVGAPHRTRYPGGDPVAGLAADLEPAEGSLRLAVAHGPVSTLVPHDEGPPGLIDVAAAGAALAEHRFHFLGLGDRHSVTRVGERIWYPGTPEVTDFEETEPGHVLLVELPERGDGEARVTPHRVGRWRFAREVAELSRDEDVDALAERIEAMPEKSRTVLRLGLVGQLPLHARTRLDEVLEDSRERLAALLDWERESELVVVPDDLDREQLGLGGFARQAAERLAAEAPSDAAAADALALLYRLVRGPR